MLPDLRGPRQRLKPQKLEGPSNDTTYFGMINIQWLKISNINTLLDSRCTFLLCDWLLDQYRVKKVQSLSVLLTKFNWI